MVRRLAPIAVFVTALAGVSSAVAAGPVWTWTDPSGRVHYGDAPPADRPARALQQTSPSVLDAPPRRPDAATQRPARAAAAPEPRAAPPAQGLRVGEGPEPTTCEGRWRRFHESAACFARFRVVGGGVKTEAFTHCADVPMPERCD